MCYTRHRKGQMKTLLAFVSLAVLLMVPFQSVTQEDRDAAWQQMLEGITMLSNLAVVRDAVNVLNAGGASAEALRTAPREFLQQKGLQLPEGALVLLINMEDNPALTPTRDDTNDQDRQSRLTDVSIAFCGEDLGVMVRRRMAQEAPRESFEVETISLTFFVERSLGYVSRVIHRLGEEENPDRVAFFHAVPTDFFIEEAARDKELGTGIRWSFLEESSLVAYALDRVGDEPGEPLFIPADQHSEEGVVTICIGYVSEKWALFVELARISEFD